jgi:hypothetical protein
LQPRVVTHPLQKSLKGITGHAAPELLSSPLSQKLFFFSLLPGNPFLALSF